LVAAIGGLPVGAAAGQTSRKTVLTVNVEKPRLEQWPISLPAGGWIAPADEAIIASEIGDLKIVELRAEVGDSVHRGQVLAVLEQDMTLAELNEKQAAVQAARADYSLAKAKGDRARKLVATGSFARQQYEEDIYIEESTAGKLAMAEAALERQRLRLEKTTIMAVDDGYISLKSAALGQVATTGAELFRLVRQGRVEWRAEISVGRVGQVKAGQRALINLPGGFNTEGQALFVEPTVKKESARATVRVAVDNGLKIGAYVSGVILIGESPALTVPESAVVTRDGFSYLFAVKPDGRVSRIRVDVGRRREGRAEISGIAETALIVQSGGIFLADNDPVRVESGRESL
jgi:RND family efflux transporter MFP subunit